MNKKTATLRDIQNTRIWRNFFLLYSALLAALYVALSLTSHTQQTPLYGDTSQPDRVNSAMDSSAISETRLASYEAYKKR